jgi:hypothetical protein
VTFCADVLPIFQRECSTSLCHGAPQGASLPAEGLVLETSDGIAATAIRRVSQESNTGSQAGLGLPQGRLFGVDMAIVEPGDPGSSWLLYKVLLGQARSVDDGLDAGFAACGDAGAPPPVGQTPSPQPSLPLSASEREILAQYILGAPMPYPLNLPADQPTPEGDVTATSSVLPLTFDELERVRAWIAQGATVTECNACSK